MRDVSFLSRQPTHEHGLDNGLTVLIREDHSAPVVAIVTHVKAGYFNEPDPLVGISHVLEHMYFKGTERRGVGEIAQQTKAAGGYVNAGTIYDYTSYYTVLPSASLELGLDIQADALLHSEIDEEELRKELLVIVQEAKRKLDNPGAVATETLYELMFDVHPMRRWRIGTEEVLTRLRRADVWDYYRNLYRPSNIVLVVSGDVDPAQTLRLVERLYGHMPAGEAVKPQPLEEPGRTGLRVREISGDIVRTHVEWGWRTPGTLHADTPALDLLAAVLGHGRASRLYQGVRETGLVTSISAYNYTPTELGVFGVGAELPPADVRAAIAAVWREVDALRRDGPVLEEVERAKNMLEARVLKRLETVEGQAKLLAEWQALGDWRMAEDYLRRLLATSPDDLRRVARDYLALDGAALLVYRPGSAEALGVDAEELRELLDAETRRRGDAATASARADVSPRDDLAASPLRRVAASGWERGGEEDGVHFYELPNGVRVAIQPRRASPLVAMAIAARGGSVDEAESNAGITALMARSSVKGTQTRTARELAVEAEALGGVIGPGVSADFFDWSLSLPSRHFAAGFRLLADVALRPAFPEPEVERERKAALDDLDALRDDMFRYPLRLFLQGAFAGHAYGTPVAATEAALRRLTPADLADWHRSRLLESAPWILVVGDVEADEAVATIAQESESVRGGPASDGARPPVWPGTPREEAGSRGKEQTALILGFPGPTRNDPDVYSLRVLSSILSGLGGRFFEELRSRRSLAYTVTTLPISRWLGGAFAAYIATSPEKEEEARRGLLDGFERLSTEDVTREELERAQRYAIGAWQIRSQTNGAHLADLMSALLLGQEGLRELRELEERIRAVTPASIREAVQRWFDAGRLVEGIVRGTGAG